MKFLHELGSYGMGGGFAVQLLALVRNDDASDLITMTALWLVLPSLILVIVTGLVAMVLRPHYFEVRWVWLKIFLTVPTFYAVVATLPTGRVLPTERTQSALWLALVATVIVTALSVWRKPR